MNNETPEARKRRMAAERQQRRRAKLSSEGLTARGTEYQRGGGVTPDAFAYRAAIIMRDALNGDPTAREQHDAFAAQWDRAVSAYTDMIDLLDAMENQNNGLSEITMRECKHTLDRILGEGWEKT